MAESKAKTATLVIVTEAHLQNALEFLLALLKSEKVAFFRRPANEAFELQQRPSGPQNY